MAHKISPVWIAIRHTAAHNPDNSRAGPDYQESRQGDEMNEWSCALNGAENRQ